MFWLADALIHSIIHHKKQGGRHIWRHSVLSPSLGSAPLVGMNKPGKFSKPHFPYLKSFKNNTYSRAVVKSDLNNRCYIVAIQKCHSDPSPKRVLSALNSVLWPPDVKRWLLGKNPGPPRSVCTWDPEHSCCEHWGVSTSLSPQERESNGSEGIQ